MFEPGHLHRANLPNMPGMPEFAVDIYYEVRNDPEQGMMMHFRMVGDINAQSFEEEFELHRDTAFNFASSITRIAAKHGLHPSFGAVLRNHKEYDLMFEDIREKLKAVPGEAVNLDHLLKDGF
ncbi:MAG: DUF5064 domain-containing protein [Pseudomonadales bacterium RIFCSPLOWO2_12_59_9]|uniref:DUF5064 family protein n=1 Tax=Pseudomonas sp. TaxID=306 RepID=UPI0008CE176D|nr:DUF5064 family protein [Pseudomonas sp.]OHC29879.1 MAG: DUF5064 domain-containing protein [Pseudomonadales bacterium RIFCSPLOWO2_12_59_9]